MKKYIFANRTTKYLMIMKHVKKTYRNIGMIAFLMFSGLLLPSCIDSLFDLNKEVSTELSVGGDSLALPLGSTDTIRLGDFLSDLESDFLESLEDGGYGITTGDTIEQEVPAIDASNLKLADQVFTQSSTVDFGEMDLSTFKIPGFNKKDTMDMNIPKIDIGNVAPSVSLNKDFTVSFSDYQLDQSTLALSDIDRITKNDNLLGFLPAGNNPIAVDFGPTSLDIGNLNVTIDYNIDVPEGISNIYQIDLDAGAELEISLELDTANQALSAGNFVPNISIDPTNLFKINPLTPLENGKIVFGNDKALTGFNAYKSKKTYTIDAFHNLPGAVNKAINISKIVNIAGDLQASGTVNANSMAIAKKIDLKINVSIKNVKIKNMDFEVPPFSTSLSGNSSFSINNSSMPEQVKKINTIYLENKNGATYNMVIKMQASNLPTMITPDYKIQNLALTFPSNFAFSNMAGQTYQVSNAVFDPAQGLTINLNLSEIDMSGVNITNQTLAWTGDITYTGDIRFGGRMNSSEIKPIDPNVNLSSTSNIGLKSADVTTNDINESLTALSLPITLDIDIAKEVKNLGTINLKDGAVIRLDFTKPVLPLTMNGDIKLKFSSMFEFKSNPNIVNNVYTISGPIPDYIEVELTALHINKDLTDGVLTLNDSIVVEGGVTLLSGNVNSAQIQALDNEKLIAKATVSDLYIASTTLQLNTLEANFSDSTSLDMEFADVPAEIVSLDSILLQSGAQMAMDISVTNMPNLSSPINADIKLKFPELLVFNPGEVNASNELTISGTFVNGKLSKIVGLKGMKFDGKPLAGKLAIKDKMKFDVAVSVNEPNVNSEELTGKQITVAVNVKLTGITFKSVYGIVDPKIDDINESFDLGDLLPEMLKGDDVVLDISNPVISLAISSNIGIPVDVNFDIMPMKDGNVIAANIINATLNIPRTNNALEIKETGFWIAPTNAGIPTGYNYIEANVTNLFKPIPDQLSFKVKPVINTGVQHFIDLAAQYKLKVAYQVKIPLTFGKDLSILIRDTIQDINPGIGSMSVDAKGIELFGNIYNSIPLNLDAVLIPMDKDNNILSEPMNLIINAGAPDGSATKTPLSLTLSNVDNTLKNLNKMVLEFKATSNATVAGTPIKKDNFIKAELKARVPGGVQIKL